MRRRSYLAITSAACLTGYAGLNALKADQLGGRSTGPTDGRGGSQSDSQVKREPLLPEAADDFEDLSRWSIHGGSMSADTDQALVGTQSARITTPARSGVTRLSLEYESPFDLSDVVPGVAMAGSEFIYPWLRLLDVDGNKIDYRRGAKGGMPLMRYNFGVDKRDEEFDFSAVREVHLQLWTPTGQTPTIWFDDFHFVPRPDTGKVMIQFDDNHVTDYTRAFPLLEDYGYRAVSFVNPSRIEAETAGSTNPGGYPRITIDQAHELHDAGWILGNHSYDHERLGELDAAEQEQQIRSGKEWLENEGFEDGARYFGYPHGSYDATTLELVRKYHTLGFGGGPPVQGYNVNRVLNSRIGEPSVDRMAVELKRTAEMRGITSFFYHRLEGELFENFAAIIKLLHEYESAGKIDVILPPDLEHKYLF